MTLHWPTISLFLTALTLVAVAAFYWRTRRLIEIGRQTHESEKRYRQLFQQMQEAVFVSTPEGQLLDCNDAMVRMLGYKSKQELQAIDITQHYADPAARAKLLEKVADKDVLRNVQVELRRKDGTPITVLESSFATRDENGQVMCLQGFLLDVTEKRRAEEEVRSRNRELYFLNAISNVATQSFDLPEIIDLTLHQIGDLFLADCGSFYFIDSEKSRLQRQASFGHRSAFAQQMADVALEPALLEHLKKNRLELIPTATLLEYQLIRDFVEAEGIKSWMWAILWQRERPIGVLGLSYRRERTFSNSDRALMLSVARQLETTIQKIHLYEETRRAYEDLRQAQEQLLQSEKMRAVGQLISGVAHELNNPLTAILGYAQLLEGEELNERERDYVSKLYKQAQRTQKIVQNLLSFSRQRKPQKQVVDMRSVVEETLTLRDYDLKLNDIEVRFECAENLPKVVADSHQLEQVFLNILNNAVDAILEHGRSGRIETKVWSEAPWVMVSMRDSGPGLGDPKRVFDPFYTTKAVGKGTGLGLSICYGIIKEHGGEIRAHNHDDGGAVFEVRLPIAAEDARADEKPVTAEKHRLSGRVLVVDDEEAVLEMETEVLTRAGAEVVAVSSPEGAMELLRNPAEHFQVVILDGKMPGCTGVELYAWIAENRPELCRSVMLAHSHTDDDLRKEVERNGLVYLNKPFDSADLVALTRRVLFSTAAAGR